MKYAALLFSFVLCACATNPPAPVLPKTVEVPVPVQCKTPDPQKPTYHFNPPYTTVFNGVRDLMGDRDQSLAYEIELEAALKSCK